MDATAEGGGLGDGTSGNSSVENLLPEFADVIFGPKEQRVLLLQRQAGASAETLGARVSLNLCVRVACAARLGARGAALFGKEAKAEPLDSRRAELFNLGLRAAHPLGRGLKLVEEEVGVQARPPRGVVVGWRRGDVGGGDRGRGRRLRG